MAHLRFLFPLALVASVAACKDKPSAAAAVDAGTPRALPEASVAVTPLDDLLHFTDATIAVSSKVDNPHDFAEHVADGRLDTAWNGKTGDLVGGWLGFRVPKEARVRIVELTVGYVATSKKGEDLFATNHRIARVRITRDGAKVTEKALDPDSREYQRIALDEPGGDFKIEVLETKPGTKAAWRELVVSELRVFGVAGPAKRATAGVPRVRVGSFDAPPPALVGKPTRPKWGGVASTPEQLCDAWLKEERARHAAKLDAGTYETPWEPSTPECKFAQVAKAGGATVFGFELTAPEETWRSVGVLRDGRARFVGPDFATASNFDPHCTGYSGGKVLGARTDGDALVVEIYRFEVSNPWPEVLEDGGLGEGHPGSVDMAIDELRCTFGDAGDTPTCAIAEVAKRRSDVVSDPENPPPRPWKRGG